MYLNNTAKEKQTSILQNTKQKAYRNHSEKQTFKDAGKKTLGLELAYASQQHSKGEENSNAFDTRASTTKSVSQVQWRKLSKRSTQRLTLKEQLVVYASSSQWRGIKHWYIRNTCTQSWENVLHPRYEKNIANPIHRRFHTNRTVSSEKQRIEDKRVIHLK